MKKDTKGRYAYHGVYDKVNDESYINEYGKEVVKSTCYFNPFFDTETLKTYGYEAREFQYLFPELAKDADALLDHSTETITKLKALAEFLTDEAAIEKTGEGNTVVPPGYTYWGQFLDHDISAGTDRSHGHTLVKDDFDPIAPDQVKKDIKNLRSAFFDLDSLYGDKEGPFCHMHRLYHPADMAKFKIGQNAEGEEIPGEVPNPALGKMRDLPRNGDGLLADKFHTIALIGDGRNDENTIIGQFHLALLKFHNRVVDELRQAHSGLTTKQVFFKAKREVKFHYQWLIVHDFLKRMLNTEIYELLLAELNDEEAPNIFDDFGNSDGNAFMPLEFSTAAYRFGHSMVRNNYDFNLNFGSGSLTDPNDTGRVIPEANFGLLFAFTGKGGERLAGGDQPTIKTSLPFNWIIEWERFFDTDKSQLADQQFARKLDTKLALPLTNLENDQLDLQSRETKYEVMKANISEAQFNGVMTHLSMRNLLRGYLLSIPVSQAIVKELQGCGLAIDHLSEAELLSGMSEEFTAFMQGSGFLEKTPLWFYILKEAEVKEGGERLGKLGSYIIGRTFIGLLKTETNDPYYNKGSYDDVDVCAYIYDKQNGETWQPSDGIVYRKTGAFSGIMDLLRFAEVAIPKAELEAIVAARNEETV